MKKNVIAHMTAPKEMRKSFWRKLDLFPRILCLVLALLIWLFVVNVYEGNQEEASSAQETVETEA